MRIKTLLKIDAAFLFAASIVLGLSKVQRCPEMSLKQFIFVMVAMIMIALYAIVHAQAAEACDE